MAQNHEWASNFFNQVTSRLPDLLTEHGEGKELVAFNKLGEELAAKDKEAKAERAKQLQAELDELNGKTPKKPEPAADAALAPPVPSEGKPEAEAKPARR